MEKTEFTAEIASPRFMSTHGMAFGRFDEHHMSTEITKKLGTECTGYVPADVEYSYSVEHGKSLTFYDPGDLS